MREDLVTLRNRSARRWMRSFLLLLPGFWLVQAGVAGTLPAGGKVVEVYDGDTILLDSGDKVRYLGIDAPELWRRDGPADCFGKQAKEMNERYVLHRRVSLEYDRNQKDRYGRLLAYVLLPDGKCVNAEMLRAGCAYVYRSGEGFSRQEEFLEQQQHAIHNHWGMWAACPVVSEAFYLGNKRSFVLHRPQCPLGRKMGRATRIRFLSRWQALSEGFRPCRRCQP